MLFLLYCFTDECLINCLLHLLSFLSSNILLPDTRLRTTETSVPALILEAVLSVIDVTMAVRRAAYAVDIVNGFFADAFRNLKMRPKTCFLSAGKLTTVLRFLDPPVLPSIGPFGVSISAPRPTVPPVIGVVAGGEQQREGPVAGLNFGLS